MTFELPADVEIPQPNWLDQLGLGLGQGMQQGTQMGLQSLLQNRQQQIKNQGELQKLLLGQQLKDQSPQAQKAQMEITQQQQATQSLGNSLVGMSEIMKAGHTGPGKAVGALFSPTTREQRAKFESLGAGILGKAIEMLNRGSLSEGHYNKIKELLPKVGDTNSTIRGKLSGIGEVLGMPLESLGISFEKEGGLKERGAKKLAPKGTGTAATAKLQVPNVAVGTIVRHPKTKKLYRRTASGLEEVKE